MRTPALLPSRCVRAYLPSRRGLSAVEVLLSFGLLALLLVPTYSLFTASHEMGLKSHLAYLALHAAREEMEDLRVLASFEPSGCTRLAHGWRAVSGDVLDRLAPLGDELPKVAYPAEYQRIFTRVDLGPPRGTGLVPATLTVWWQEHGQAPTEADRETRRGLSRFDFLLVDGTREVPR